MGRTIRSLCLVLTLAFVAIPVSAREPVENIGSFAVGAKGAVVMEAMTGRVLFSQDAERQLPIASTTKIMTALLTLEQPDIYATFEVDGEAIRVEGSSMGLQDGDKLSLYALAQGMLLASGNDGANAAAVRIAGSLPAFAEIMNARARQIGMENTCFITPSGLDDEAHYSTAFDMALLAREALRNSVFAGICSQYRMRASYGNPPHDRWLTNHNKLLNYYDGAVGVKTGFTKKSGRCLVSAATRDGVTLICVTLSCSDDWNVHKSLLDSCFEQIEIKDLSKGISFLAIPVTGGVFPEIRVAHCETAQLPVPIGSEIDYRITAPPFLYAPVQAGQYVGEAVVLVDGREAYWITLVSAQEIPLKYDYDENKSILSMIMDFFLN